MDLGLSESYLLRRVLAWYADPKNWKTSGYRVPSGSYVVMGRRPSTLQDSGTYARSTIAIQGVGALFKIVCDVEDVAITDICQRSNISMSRVSEIVQDSPILEEESIKLRQALEASIKARL